MRRSVYRKRPTREFETLEVRHLLAAQPIISEFQAANDATLLDGDGNSSDWIELYNAGDEAIDLQGWYLTDDADNLKKWPFPSIGLAPEAFLVIFASGQDDPVYVDPTGHLHTNFSLSREGGYVALVEPDSVTVVSEFTYPQQLMDVSYGLTNGRETEFVVDLQAPVTASVPSDDALGTEWTAIDFNDDDWIIGTTGVGYEQLEASYSELDEFDAPLGSEWNVDIPAAGTSTVTMANGNLRMNVPAGQDITSDRGLAPLVLRGLPEQNSDFEFTTRVSVVSGNGLAGIVLFDADTQQNVFSLEFNRLNSLVTQIETKASTEILHRAVRLNLTDVSLRISRDAVLNSWTTSFRLTDTDPWTELGTFAEGGEDLGQISPSQIGLMTRTTSAAFIADFHYADLSVAEEQPFYGARSGLVVSGEMFNVNSSIYTRLPFNIAGDTTRFTEMDLAIDYDDGFTAYLNGTEIARRNAPAGVTWDSAATDVHGAVSGQLSTEVINVDAFVDQLLTGENLLAIHGLNVDAADRDFFMSPVLAAINPEGNSVIGYFTSPTPGASNADEVSPLGPTVSHVEHSPNIPTSTDPLVVTARFSPATPFPVAGGSVVYRIMYGGESSVPMVDDGTGNDELAGDGIFTGVIPAGVAQPGEMLRYFVESRDNRNNRGRSPLVEDTEGTDQSPEYYGTVIADPAVTSDLTILHWFTDNVAAASTRGGWRASVFYAGEFYDNIFVRQRGGATNNRSQKFNFDDDHPFYVNEELGRVQEFNLNAEGSDSSFIRQPMAFESYSDVGNPSSASFLTRVEVNGEFDRVGVFIEQVDEDLLERYGFDPEGALYKFVQRGNLDPVFNDTVTGVEKKTRLDEGIDDLQALVTGLNLPTIEERRAFMLDNLNLPEFLNYLSVRSITLEADDVRKNFYMHRDTHGTGEWSIIPWDKDWTFGVTGDGGTYLRHPFFGDFDHRKQNGNQWNKLYDDFFADPVTREMFLRRLRSVMDELLQSGDLAEGELLRYEARVDEIVDQARGDLSGAAISAANSVKSFFPGRRQYLYEVQSIDNLNDHTPELLLDENNDGILYFVPTNNDLGLSWNDMAPPDNIAVWQTARGGIGYENTPGTYEEFIETNVKPGDACDTCTSIYLRIPFEVSNVNDIRDMTLQLQYDDGYVAYLNGTEIAKSLLFDPPGFDTTPFLNLEHSGVSFSDIDVTQYIDLLNEGSNVLAIHSFNKSSDDSDQLITPRLYNGTFVVNEDVAGIPHEQVGNPQITFGEIDYSPISGDQDEEYIELINDNDTAVDISGWRLIGGVDHVFASGTVIPAGWSYFVTPSVNAFRARATGPSGGQSLFVQGNYSGHISSFGETIRLLGRDNQMISTVTTPTDPSNLEQTFLRVSEINYHPAAGGVEFIELINVHSDTVDASGVTLALGPSDPYIIPQGTLIPAGGHVVITEDPTALVAAYPDVDPESVLGPYLGGLSNGGERIKFNNARGETLIDFTYNDSGLWPRSADGWGSSLAFIDPVAGTDNYSHYFGWRASSAVGGSPGSSDAPPQRVAINEVLSNTDASAAVSDSIELLNASAATVDISGWFLSDSANDLLKFEIPLGTLLAPGQTIVFDESDFNPTPNTPAEDHFALSGTAGDDVWLVVPNEAGGVEAFVDEVHFDEAASLVSFGRVPESNVLVPMGRTTLGAANNQPIVGPLVISEVAYHPGIPSPEAVSIARDLDQNDLEFVELHNASVLTIDLGLWRIRGEVDIDFDLGTTIAPSETVVITSFDPTKDINADKLAAFRVHYGLDETTRLIGGYSSSLSDSDGRVRLQQQEVFPADPEDVVGHVTQDEVIYADRTPWPTSADGDGNSLHRRSKTSLGNDPAQWDAAVPNPGTVALDGGSGDFDGDGSLTADDIDMVYNAINASLSVTSYDLDGSGTIDSGDATHLIENILGIHRGDADLDGRVNASDLNFVGLNWQRTNGAGWSTGDFTGDGRVDASDLNNVGVNWLKGVPAQAARAPRAPLAITAQMMDSSSSHIGPSVDQFQYNADTTAANSRDHHLLRQRRRTSMVGRRSLSRNANVSQYTESIDLVFADLQSAWGTWS